MASSQRRLQTVLTHLRHSSDNLVTSMATGAHNGTTISSHALDQVAGRPAAGLNLVLQVLNPSGTSPYPDAHCTLCNEIMLNLTKSSLGQWEDLHRDTTNSDGRVTAASFPKIQRAGLYKMKFDTAAYFASQGITKYFYPTVEIIFEIPESGLNQHYHIPLLLSPYGYTTYRGS